MSVTVRVPTQLRTLTGGVNKVEVPAGSIAGIVAALESAHPGFAERLLDDNGKVRRYVNLFVDDEDIRFTDGLETKVKDGQTVSVVPAVAGGMTGSPLGGAARALPGALLGLALEHREC